MASPRKSIKTLYNRLLRLREKKNVQWELLEQDYLLSWVLAGISQVEELKSNLIFKGGTALKKTYFGDYRFSQDLDFTVSGTLPNDSTLESLIREACKQAEHLQAAYKDPVYISVDWYAEKEPHPHNQKAFTVKGQFPWHRDPRTAVMIEITTEEPVVLAPELRTIIHQEYDEQLSASIYTYPLEEIVCEKIRAILQFAKKLHERGWGRSRARDYYDLWRIFSDYKEHLDLTIIPELVTKKCVLKEVQFNEPAQLFSQELMEDLDVAWQRWLAPFVPNLPSKEQVLKELRHELDLIWSTAAQPALDVSKQLH